MAEFKPPLLEKQVERSLADEFDVAIAATDWSKFENVNPNLLQASVMMQSSGIAEAGRPMTIRELVEDNEEVEKLAQEVETGDYKRYSSPAFLLEGLDLQNQQVRDYMRVAAYHVSLSPHLHPRARQGILKTIYCTLMRSQQKLEANSG